MSNQKKPAISIIVPVYNAEKYIGRCLDSILAQTFSDYELILVNDGSTDTSGKICDDYSRLENRISVVHKPNGGQSTARNAGVEIAKGSYLGFVDADDYIAPTMLQTLYDLVISYQADISECGYISVFKDREVVCEFGKGIEFGEGNYLTEKFINADIFYGVVTKLFKASLFDHVHFPHGRIYEDTWMTLNFCLEPLKYVRTEQPLYYYDQTASSTLRSELTQRKAREYIYILENQLALIERKVADNYLKKRLFRRIMEKSVFWYLDLALSKNRKIRPYSRLYLRRMDYTLIDCIRSNNIPFRNKLSFLICKTGFSGVLRFIKNRLS